jgi:hypothetical protein
MGCGAGATGLRAGSRGAVPHTRRAGRFGCALGGCQFRDGYGRGVRRCDLVQLATLAARSFRRLRDASERPTVGSPSTVRRSALARCWRGADRFPEWDSSGHRATSWRVDLPSRAVAERPGSRWPHQDEGPTTRAGIRSGVAPPSANPGISCPDLLSDLLPKCMVLVMLVGTYWDELAGRRHKLAPTATGTIRIRIPLGAPQESTCPEDVQAGLRRKGAEPRTGTGLHRVHR